MVFSNITRGGQTSLHQIRMFMQIIRKAFIFGLIVGTLVFAYGALQLNVTSLRILCSYLVCEAETLVYQSLDMDLNNRRKVFFYQGQEYNIAINKFGSLPLVKYHIKSTIQHITEYAFYSFLSMIGTIVTLSIFWNFYGARKRKQQILKGNKIISAKQLKKLLYRQNKSSSISLASVPLLKDSEPQHMLLTGCTGSGKSNCIIELLQQIRTQKQKAVIIDITGIYVAKFFRENQDILLNPFDRRSQNWSPWADCVMPYHYEALSSALISDDNKYDPFWNEAARNIFATTLIKMKTQNDYRISRALHYMLNASLKECEEFYKGTKAQGLLSTDSEKTSASVRMQLNTKVKSLNYLTDASSPFSLRSWIDNNYNNGQWLFISSTPAQRSALKSLNSLWFDLAINSLMELAPCSERRVWFIVDELPGLQYLPSLKTAMAELRKYGGCMVAGIQSINQVFDIYDYNMGSAILSSFGTKVHFRETEPKTIKWISDSIGSQKQQEVQESLSYGANDIRDGVNLSEQTKMEHIVLPSDIANLRNLEAYLRLPENWPVTKLQFKYHKLPQICESFLMKDMMQGEIASKICDEKSYDESSLLAVVEANETPKKSYGELTKSPERVQELV